MISCAYYLDKLIYGPAVLMLDSLAIIGMQKILIRCGPFITDSPYYLGQNIILNLARETVDRLP